MLRSGGGGLRAHGGKGACDINLATGCVRALPLLLPSCGRQRGGGRAQGLLRAGEGAARAAALGGSGGGVEHKKQASARASYGAGLPKRQGSVRARHREGARSSAPTARA